MQQKRTSAKCLAAADVQYEIRTYVLYHKSGKIQYGRICNGRHKENIAAACRLKTGGAG